jgi:heme O synthase-like polyprenyltransferase
MPPIFDGVIVNDTYVLFYIMLRRIQRAEEKEDVQQSRKSFVLSLIYLPCINRKVPLIGFLLLRFCPFFERAANFFPHDAP